MTVYVSMYAWMFEYACILAFMSVLCRTNESTDNNNNTIMSLSLCQTVVISIIISIIYRVKQIHKHRLPYLREYAPPRAEVYEGTYSLNTIKNKSSSIT